MLSGTVVPTSVPFPQLLSSLFQFVLPISAEATTHPQEMMVNMIAALSKVMMGGGGGTASAEDRLLNLTMLRPPAALRQGTIDNDALGNMMTILPRSGSRTSLAKAVSFLEPASSAASGAGAQDENEAEHKEETESDGENKEDANDEVLPPARALALRTPPGSSPIAGREKNAKRGRSVEDTTALIA